VATAYQFFRPIAYLMIKGPSLNVYRYKLPLLATAVVGGLFIILPAKFDLVGDKSLSDYLISFFSSLPGFYIAALAAVVAFAGGDLDQDMPEVTLKMTAHGDTANNPITLRVFLCFLFSYLTVLSFVGFFICLAGAMLASNVTILASGMSSDNAGFVAAALKTSFLATLVFLSASVVFCTVQGLYFLAERVHQKLL
jgi:hypothetical protein